MRGSRATHTRPLGFVRLNRAAEVLIIVRADGREINHEGVAITNKLFALRDDIETC